MSMQQLVLSFENRSEVLELPWPLQEHSLGNPHNTYTFNTINTGEVLAIGRKKLKELTITSTFPSRQYPFLLSKKFLEPNACIQKIEKWRLSGKPIRVAIMDTDINLAMAIESFEYGHADGDGSGDVMFTLSLREYSYLNVERSKKATKSRQLKSRPTEKKKSVSNYVVKKGDTLWDLADRNLGSGRRWREIAKLNGIKNPRRLQIGTKLKIPPRSKK